MIDKLLDIFSKWEPVGQFMFSLLILVIFVLYSIWLISQMFETIKIVCRGYKPKTKKKDADCI